MTDGPLFDEDADPVERSRALDQQLLAIPADRVFTKRAVIIGFAVIMVLVVVGFGWTFQKIDDNTEKIDSNTAATNEAVTQEIPGLTRQLEARDATIAEQQDLLRQATDAVVLLLDLLEANGIDAPPIRIEPTTTTTGEQP